MKTLKTLVFICILAAALTGLLYFMELKETTKSPRDSLSQVIKVIEVQKGTSPKQIAAMLEKEEIIKNADRFYYYGKWLRQWTKVKAGEYGFSASMNADKIFSVLHSGISISKSVTIKEGANIYETAAILKEKGFNSEKFLNLCKSLEFIKSLVKTNPLPPTMEGYLYPETYFFQKNTSAEEIIRTFYKKHLEIWSDDFDERISQLGFSKHQALTLASMIEKETGAAHERPMISSVFHNRLKKKMRLQSDPTTIYGIWDRYTGNIKKSDLLQSTPYNTYTVPALPTGPIGNPGIESMKAALYPDTSEYLFFVSHNDGTHEFTKTFKDHNQAVKDFQLNPKARTGKSWRDLKNKPTSKQ